MNTNESNEANRRDAAELNELILRKQTASRWFGRGLTGVALALGALAILAGVLIALVGVVMISPKENQMLKQTMDIRTQTVKPATTPAEALAALQRDEVVESDHFIITFAHEKEIFILAVAVALLGLGTLVTLGLVLFNRRVTLAQINVSLAEISAQMKERQSGNS